MIPNLYLSYLTEWKLQSDRNMPSQKPSWRKHTASGSGSTESRPSLGLIMLIIEHREETYNT